ncbi:CLUMA_CG002639, isoform A [Clunio marinus]|uniref:CLUMA_CG002639, isoform A n=1 Tax=Clunio marinus TaxID=568069 RepID=A0A1J1HLZ4_9DIPT|nr:CLUMA_CG002639, isoform A [Clunio marinus]
MEQLAVFLQTPPSWLDQSFFEKVIKKHENDPDGQVIDFKVVPGSQIGDNFASAVFRCSITYKSKYTKEPKVLSTFIKVQPQFPPEMSHFQNVTLFTNEIEMFSKVLPEIQSLWTSINDKDILCPQLIYQSTDPALVLILKDVSGDGFAITQKPPEDYEVSKRIFRRLAKYHASTFFLANEKKYNFEHFNFTMIKNPMMHGMFSQIFNAFCENAKAWDGFEKFIPHLENFKKDLIEKTGKVFTANTGEFSFNILNHADFHLKNILFKNKSDGSMEDFYIIDYQLCFYGTPAIDLIYALYYFVTPQNRLKYRAELIALYYEEFADSLKKFGYLKAPPSLIDLQVELLRNGSFEVVLAICMSIFFFIDFGKLREMGIDFIPSAPGEGMKKIFNIVAGFKDNILQELPRWCYNGFI